MKYTTAILSNTRVLAIENWPSAESALRFLESIADYTWIELFYLRSDAETLLFSDKRGGRLTILGQGVIP